MLCKYRVIVMDGRFSSPWRACKASLCMRGLFCTILKVLFRRQVEVTGYMDSGGFCVMVRDLGRR